MSGGFRPDPQALRLAAASLRAAAVADPLGDARRLAEHAADDAAWQAALTARAARQPVSQIIGGRDFWKHRFRVTRDTLDPRPETETLVQAALDLPWQTVLDLGTGTGAILISLLAERPDARGLGIDISPAAAAVARENAARIGVEARVIVGDWFAGVAERFDLIVSNPPYIAAGEMAGLAPEVRDWEPAAALTDGGDGLGAYRAIVAGAAAHLTPGGHLAVETGPTQAAAVTAFFGDAGFGALRVIADLDGRDRVVLGRFGG
ncbi:peptide chain release factor N(5)-glutamine methyltransferase [Paracoccus pacificus]|uniref:Release factor glutamine methyltransferase n=1 Tax=Paracoccus pacificus TaxID=1463598 RepID=A0ABW4R9F4_9RHOB